MIRTTQMNDPTNIEKLQQQQAVSGTAASAPAAARAAAPEKPYPPLAGISRAGRANAYAYRPEQPASAKLRTAEDGASGAETGRPGALQTMRLWAEAAENVASGDTHYDNTALPASALTAREEDVKSALDSALASIMDMVNGAGKAGSSEDEPKTGCETCASRVYKDGSNDAGVSFQSPKGMPASTSGIFVASHEGEHVTRETARAHKNGEIITNMKVTLQMDCCPECNRLYVKGGTTSFTKMSGKNGDGAVVTKLADLLGNAGEKFDLSY